MERWELPEFPPNFRWTCRWCCVMSKSVPSYVIEIELTSLQIEVEIRTHQGVDSYEPRDVTQDTQCAYNVTSWRVCLTFVPHRPS